MFTWFSHLTGPWPWLVGLIGVVIGLAVLWICITMLLLPLLALIQHLIAPAENSTSISDDQYLLGTLTLAVTADHTGEVMIAGGGRARQTYPAKLWTADGPALKLGEQVVVVDVDHGIAYVERFNAATAPRA
ncbi:NfeD family protein [Lacticaseibacillus absianus]|uniref:NfeD family protein n=1 Tax=Lacticaseibacillus absianus TaxID=2729623 RepID=UPI0015CBF3FC|nr:NfeD family protein [Lacticaseibacillus absianus]